MALTHPGWAVLVVLLVAATGPVAATHVAPAHETPTASTGATLAATGTPLDDPTTPTNETTDETTTTVDDTTDTVENTTDNTTNTVNDTTTDTTTTTDETTDTVNDTTTDTTTTTDTATTTDSETVDDTVNETVDATDEGTENVTDPTDTVDNTADTVDDTTDTVGSTVDDTNENATGAVNETTDSTLTDTTLTGSSRTDTTLTDTTSDTLDGSVETTDDVSGVLTDEEGSLSVSSGSDSGLLLLNAAATTGSDDDSAGSTAGGSDGGDGAGGEGDSGGDEAATSVDVETADQQVGPVTRVGGAAWETLDGYVPEDAPVGPVGATGVGALAVLAVASRQWFVQSSGTGMSSLLSAGVSGSMGDWVEKLKHLAVPLRYSRYDDSDPLEHDTRRVLHDTIDAAPGINLTALADETDVPLSTARHHVRVLEDENLVTTAKRHGKRRFYPMGVDDVALADALSEPPKAAVLHALAEHGEAHVGLLADELDRDPSTITHHLQTLADDDVVEREKRGRTVVNRLSDSAQATLCGDAAASGTDYAELPADD